MKTVLVCLLILFATHACGQSLQDCYNNIGIFTAETPDMENLWEYAHYYGPPGQITVYVVLIYPHNENTGELIQTVGGYEFRLEIHESIFVTPHLPPSAFNFLEYPEFYCGAELPVVGNQCVLLSLDIGTFTTDPTQFYLTPISNAGAQSIPGDLAITDADDEHSLSRATPVSGNYLDPVFSMFDIWWASAGQKYLWEECWVVPNQTTSWGSIKAMYR